MKNLIKYLMVLQFGLSTVLGSVSFAQAVPEVSQETANFEKDLQTAIYSIREIPAIIKDLKGMTKAASNAISENVAKDIYIRFDTAFSLITLIMLDTKLTEEQKYNMTEGLAAELGAVLLKVALEYERHGLTVDKLIQKINNTTTADRMQDIAKEMLFDLTIFKNLESAEFANKADATKLDPKPDGSIDKPLNVDHVMVRSFKERGNRNDLSIQLADRMKSFSQATYPKLADGKLEKWSRGFWAESVLEKALRFRQYRERTEKATAATYFGLAVWGLVAPHVDVVGLATFSQNDFTHFSSSIIYFVGWTIAGTTKMSLSSTKVRQALEDTISLFKNPAAADSQVVTDGKSTKTVKLSFRQKMSLLSRNVINSCKLLVGMKPKDKP